MDQKVVCPKCNANENTPCAYPDFDFRDCPIQQEQLKRLEEWWNAICNSRRRNNHLRKR